MVSKIEKKFEKYLFTKILNKWIYISFLIISIIIILFIEICNLEFLTSLENIAYSIIAAVILAVFIDYNSLKQNINEKNNFKTNYFKVVNNYLSLIVGHLIWLYDNQDCESIDWDSNNYFEILCSIDETKCQCEYEIPFDQAIKKIGSIGDEYSYSNFHHFSNDKKSKVRKIFYIPNHELKLLMGRLNKINDDKLILEINDYAKIDEIEDFILSISLCCDLIDKQDYSQAILSLINSIKLVRNFGNYGNDITCNIKKPIFLVKLIK